MYIDKKFNYTPRTDLLMRKVEIFSRISVILYNTAHRIMFAFITVSFLKWIRSRYAILIHILCYKLLTQRSYLHPLFTINLNSVSKYEFFLHESYRLYVCAIMFYHSSVHQRIISYMRMNFLHPLRDIASRLICKNIIRNFLEAHLYAVIHLRNGTKVTDI